MNMDEVLTELSILVIESEEIVSYKRLALSFNIKSNAAKRVLDDFISDQRRNGVNDLRVVYFLIGHRTAEDGGSKLAASLILEEELERKKKELTKVLCYHVYSVQKASCPDSASLYTADYAINRDNAETHLRSSSIVNSIEKVSLQDRCLQLPVTKADETNLTVNQKKSLRSLHEQAVVSKQESADPETKLPNAAVKTGGKQTTFMRKKEKKGSLLSMLANQGKHKTIKPSTAAATESDNGPEEKNAEEDQIENLEMNDDCIDEVLDKENRKTTRTKFGKCDSKGKKKGQASAEIFGKRKRVQIFESSSDEESDVDPRDEIDPPGLHEQRMAVGSQVLVPETPSPGKTFHRKEVSNTHIDEKGFMVTEKVWELVADERTENEKMTKEGDSNEKGTNEKEEKKKTGEAIPAKPKGSSPKKVLLEKVMRKSPKKKAASKQKKGQNQPSMMSFFTKTSK